MQNVLFSKSIEGVIIFQLSSRHHFRQRLEKNYGTLPYHLVSKVISNWNTEIM